MHQVLVIPGLGNNISSYQWATKSWSKFGLEPHIFDVSWGEKNDTLKGKIEKAERVLKILSQSNQKVSLVGCSAGCSLAINLFQRNKKFIDKVVLNCGRIRDTDLPWFSFEKATEKSPAFKESVLSSQKIVARLCKDEKEKIMTLRAKFDELVPADSIVIEGATNTVVPSLEHMLTITLNLTLWKKKIFDFLTSS